MDWEADLGTQISILLFFLFPSSLCIPACGQVGSGTDLGVLFSVLLVFFFLLLFFSPRSWLRPGGLWDRPGGAD